MAAIIVVGGVALSSLLFYRVSSYLAPYSTGAVPIQSETIDEKSEPLTIEAKAAIKALPSDAVHTLKDVLKKQKNIVDEIKLNKPLRKTIVVERKPVKSEAPLMLKMQQAMEERRNMLQGKFKGKKETSTDVDDGFVVTTSDMLL
jgi:hypothetical protein